MTAAEFWDKATTLANDSRTDRFSWLSGNVVMKTPGRAWQEITFCSGCGADFSPWDLVHHERVRNEVFCDGCHEWQG